MSLLKNNLNIWEDIKNLYNLLNVERERFSMTTVSVPSNKDSLTEIADITDLKSQIQAMTSNGYVGSVASTSGVTVPSRGALLTPTPFTQMQTIIENISAVNGANFSSFFSSAANANGTNFSSFFSSAASKNGTNFSSFNGTNFSRFFSSGASANGTNFGSFFSSGAQANSGNFSGFFSSTSSSNGASFWSSGFANRSFFSGFSSCGSNFSSGANANAGAAFY